MRKKSLALTLMLAFSCLLGEGDLMGQTTVTIGSDGTNYQNVNQPFYAKANYSYSQQIYTLDEIGGEGTISSIAFYPTTNNCSRNLDIYLVTTTKETFSSTNDWISISGIEPVFSGNLSFITGDWNTITLTNSFIYNGNNLAVIVHDKTGSAESADTKFLYDYYFPTNTCLRKYGESLDLSNLGYGSRDKKNKIQLNITYYYPKPYAISSSSITSESASFSWTAPTATTGHTLSGYQYRYKAANGSWTSETNTEAVSCNLSGLTPYTNYTFQVRAIYTDNSKDTHYSAWAEATFITSCTVPTITWGFEGSSNDMPIGWEIAASYVVNSTTTYPRVYNNNPHNGSRALQFSYAKTHDIIVLMPEINESLNGKTLSFYAKISETGYTYNLIIGYYDANNEFVTPDVSGISITNSSYSNEDPSVGYYEYNIANFPNNIRKVAIKASISNEYRLIYLDDVKIDYTTSCTPVSSPTVGTVTYNSAQLSWTAGGSETNWKLQYRASGVESWNTVNISSANLVAGVYTLTGLSENTTYEWQVAAWCDTSDDDNISTYVAGEDFSTPVQFPMPTSLAANNISTNSADITWTAGSTETAWQLYYTPYDYATPGSASPGDYINISTTHAYTMTGLTGNTTYYVYVRANYGEDHYSSWTDAMSFRTTVLLPYSYDFTDASELNSWTLYNCFTSTGISGSGSNYYFHFVQASGYNPQYLITPLFENNSNALLISFDYRLSSGSLSNILNVGYSTTDKEIGSFTFPSSASVEVNSTSYQKLEYVFQVEGIKYIAVKFDRNGNYLNTDIDNISFTPIDKVYTGGSEEWNYLADWTPAGLPESTDDVYINNTITIPNTCTAEANNIILGPSGSLTIADGGQLILPKTSTGVQATVKKETYGATAKDAKTVYYWYAISSAVANPIISSATNLITETEAPYNYDLYRYNEAATTTNAQGQILYWENYRASHADFTTLEPGRGYLYRNANNLSIEMTGEINVADFNYSVTYSGGVLAGFNLIGNPYSHDIYKGAGTAIPNGSGLLRTGFYYMEPTTGKWTVGTDNSTAIKPNQGILVQTDANGSIEMTNTNSNGSSKSNNDNIMFKVANSQYSDEAYAWFDKGRGLNKISHRNAEVPMLYINQDGENYAIATMSDDIKTFSLNFKAMTMGKYTLSYKTKGEFNYLHVIDRFTGEDVDMLLEGEYSFVASPNDNDARFIVRLEYTSNNGTNDSSVFAYQSGNEIIVSGEGELQIFDVMGRKISTHQINGVETVNVNAHGVYIFKLNEKTQKIIIK